MHYLEDTFGATCPIPYLSFYSVAWQSPKPCKDKKLDVRCCAVLVCASGERVELELREINAKLTRLEGIISTGRQDTRFNFEEIIRQQTSINSLNDRITLVQRKLNLPDNQAHRPQSF